MAYFVAASSAALSAAGSSIATTYPSTTAGDLVVVVVANSNSLAINTPTGFTLADSNSATALRQAIFYRFLTGTESGSITITWTGSATAAIAAAAYRGMDSGLGRLDHTNTTGTTGTTHTASAIIRTRAELSLTACAQYQATSADTWTTTTTKNVIRAQACSTVTPFTSVALSDVLWSAPNTNGTAYTVTNTSTGYAISMQGFVPTVSGYTASAAVASAKRALFTTAPPRTGQLWPRRA